MENASATLTGRGEAGISGSVLKIIAAITMLIDHIGATVIERILTQYPPWAPVYTRNQHEWYQFYIVLRGIGRMAFPIYCFLLVEGFIYTRSRVKYAFRLFLFALISEVPFDMAFQQSFFDMSDNNVFFTLLIGFLVICAVDWLSGSVKQNMASAAGYEIAVRALPVAGVIMLGCLLAEVILPCDYGASGVLAILSVYLFRKYRLIGFTIAVIVLGILSSGLEYLALLMLIPLYFYNGKRGRQSKYFFYAFYPAHLFILSLICYVLGLGI